VAVFAYLLHIRVEPRFAELCTQMHEQIQAAESGTAAAGAA
jgi:hypothetical protein